MNISDLVEKIDAIFPNQFETDEQKKIWGVEAKEQLRFFIGVNLEKIWTGVLETWQLSRSPRPDELAKYGRDIIGSDKTAANDHDSAAMLRTNQAYEYWGVLIRSDIGQELSALGFLRLPREWVLEKALANINAGETPNIPAGEIRKMIPVWRAEIDYRAKFWIAGRG